MAKSNDKSRTGTPQSYLELREDLLRRIELGAIAALLGGRPTVTYEGQAAMELEALAGCRVARESRCEITGGGEEPWVLDPIPLLVELGERRQSGEDPADLAADFHASIAWATAELAQRACTGAGLKTVVLAGGVFQNARLLVSVRERLQGHGEAGLRVLRFLCPQVGEELPGSRVVFL